MLIEYGIDYQVKNSDLDTPLSYAIKNDCFDQAIMIISKQNNFVYQELNSQNSYLHLAILKNRPSLITALLKKGM